MKPISCNERNGGHRKAFVPRSPTGPCSVSKWPHIKGICLNCIWQYTKSAHVAYIFLLMNFLSLKRGEKKDYPGTIPVHIFFF